MLKKIVKEGDFMQYVGLKRIFHQDEKMWKELYNIRFNSELCRHLGIKIHQNECFYVINEEILNLIEKIYRINSWFDRLDLPNMAKSYMIFSSLLEEIHSSNKIEGIHSTHKELKELATSDSSNSLKRFYGMVNKYSKILRGEFEKVETSSDVRKLYDEILYRDVIEEDSEDDLDGLFFRKGPVEVSSGLKTIHKGINGEEIIIDWMDRSLKILNNEDIPFFVRIAVFYYFFEYIHPFYNGNGRMGRLLVCGYLCEQMNTLCAFQFSIACLHNRTDYYKMFQETSQEKNNADLTVFIIHFLEIYIKGLKELKDTVEEKNEYYLSLKKKLRQKFKDDDFYFLHSLLLVTIFSFEGMTMSEMVENEKMTQQTLRNKIKNINEKYPIIKINKENKPYHYELNIKTILGL